MRNISTKADNVGDVLPATGFNALNSELENAVTSSGQTLDPDGGPDTDVEMLGKAITIYAVASQYYQDSGAANAYVLARVGNLKPLVDYIDGVTVIFKAGNSNTGASTINVDSLGAKALRDNNDTALVGGEIIAGGYVVARYHSTNDRFEIVASQSSADSPLPSTGYYGQSLEVNSDADGYNQVGPLYAFKNKFINPWFNYWQRGGELGGTAINVTANDTYTADRMVLIFDGTADVDVEQVALGAAIKIGNRWVVNGLKVTVNTNSGNTYLRLCQRIEYVTSIIDHAAVLNSFIQGSGTLTVPVYARQDFGTGGSADVVTGFSSDLSVTSSMQELQSGVVIPDVSGKTIVDADSFLSIEYDLINLASTDYIIIPFHQFELGENNSFPEYRKKQIEDSLVERFYVRFFNLDSVTSVGTGYAYSTTAARGLVNLMPSVPMRLENPTGGYTGTTWEVLRINTGYVTTGLSFNVKAYGRSNLWSASVAAGLAADAGVILRANSGSTTSLYLDAELYQ